MHSQEFIESLDHLIARHISHRAMIKIERLANRDSELIDAIVYRSILAAFDDLRSALAQPRTGCMTFEQAIDAVVEDKMVTRPHWGVLEALVPTQFYDSRYFHHKGRAIDRFELDNLDGTPTGHGSSYSPSDEDKAATDWMYYQAPNVELWPDFSNLGQ